MSNWRRYTESSVDAIFWATSVWWMYTGPTFLAWWWWGSREVQILTIIALTKLSTFWSVHGKMHQYLCGSRDLCIRLFYCACQAWPYHCGYVGGGVWQHSRQNDKSKSCKSNLHILYKGDEDLCQMLNVRSVWGENLANDNYHHSALASVILIWMECCPHSCPLLAPWEPG